MLITSQQPGDIVISYGTGGDWSIFNSAGGIEYTGNLADVDTVNLSSEQRLVIPEKAVSLLHSTNISGSGNVHVSGVTSEPLDLSTLSISTTGEKTVSLGRLENHYEISQLGYAMDMSGDHYSDTFFANIFSGGADIATLELASIEYRAAIEAFFNLATPAVEDAFNSFVAIKYTDDSDPNRLPLDLLLGVPELASHYFRIEVYNNAASFKDGLLSTSKSDEVSGNLMFFGFSPISSEVINANLNYGLQEFRSGALTFDELTSMFEELFFEDQAIAHIVGTTWIDQINLNGFVLELDASDSLFLTIDQADGLAVNRIYPDSYDWTNPDARGEVFIYGFAAESTADLSNINTYMTLGLSNQDVKFTGKFNDKSWIDVHDNGSLDISSLELGNIPAGAYIDNGSTFVISASQSEKLADHALTNNGTVKVVGSSAGEKIFGTDGNDILHGRAGDDHLSDGYGNDEVYGGAGNDTINNIGGSDLFDGGDGNDTLITDISTGFDERSFEVGFDTVANTHGRLNSTVGQDTISDIENFTLLGNFNAVVTGGDEDNRFKTDAGDDVLSGGAGNDTLSGWMGNDKVYAGTGNDTIINTGGEDLFDGGEGVDTLVTDLSQSVKDELGFSNWDFDIVLDLAADDPKMRHYGLKPDGTDYAWDEIYSIENYTLIGDFDAQLTGDEQDNILIADTGDDILDGGAGNDILTGGAGSDIFVFKGVFNHDVVTDFYGTEDLLEVYANDGSKMAVSDLIERIDLNGNRILSTTDGLSSITFSLPSVNFDIDLPFDNLIAGYDRDFVWKDANVEINDGIHGQIVVEDFWGIGSVIDGIHYNLYLGINGFEAAESDIVAGQLSFIGVTLDDGPLDDSDDFEPDLMKVSGLNIELSKYFSSTDLGQITIDEAAFNREIFVSNNIITLSSDDDNLNAGSGNDTIDGGAGNDIIDGGAGDDVLHGGAGNDVLRTGDGTDQLFGDDGHDILHISGSGAATLNGGDGSDTVLLNLTNYTPPMDGFIAEINLATGRSGAVGVQGALDDTLISVENIDYQGVIASKLTGDENDNIISGGSGDDEIHAGDGNDTVYAGNGNDRVHASFGVDHEDGGDGVDTFVLDGDLTYVPVIDLTLKTAYLYGEQPDFSNSIVNFENIEVNSNTDFVLIGDENDNIILGGSGNDIIEGKQGFNQLEGGAGNDTLISASGRDSIYIGTGNDRYTNLASDTVWLVSSKTLWNDGRAEPWVEHISFDLENNQISKIYGDPLSALPGELDTLEGKFKVHSGNHDTLEIIGGDYGLDVYLGGGIGGLETTIVGSDHDDIVRLGTGLFRETDLQKSTSVIKNLDGSVTLQVSGTYQGEEVEVNTTLIGIEEIEVYSTRAPSGEIVLSKDFEKYFTANGEPAFDIVLSSQTNGIATFAIYADETVDPDDDGTGSFEFKLSHDPADMLIDASSYTSGTGYSGVPNYNSTTGVLQTGAFAFPSVTDTSIPLATFSATILNETSPISLTISDVLVDTDPYDGVTESFDFSSVEVESTVVSRGAEALDDVRVSYDFVTPSGQQKSIELPAQAASKVAHAMDRGSDLTVHANKDIDDASDNAIGAFDALQALRLAVGLDKSDGTSEWHDYIAADINQDGRVGADDALNILKFAVGLTDGPSAEWVFVDGDADYSDIWRGDTNYDQGVMLEDVIVDTSINMTGILVGDVDGSYIA